MHSPFRRHKLAITKVVATVYCGAEVRVCVGVVRVGRFSLPLALQFPMGNGGNTESKVVQR